MAGSGICFSIVVLMSLLSTTFAGLGHGLSTFSTHPHPFHFNVTHNATLNATNETAAAPYYRNVSIGSAWVMPSSPFDLGARAMSCECFDPDSELRSYRPLAIIRMQLIDNLQVSAAWPRPRVLHPSAFQ